MTEDETVGWHHQFNGHELGQTLRDGEGQGSLVYCSPWDRKELDTTWGLNNNSMPCEQARKSESTMSVLLEMDCDQKKKKKSLHCIVRQPKNHFP